MPNRNSDGNALCAILFVIFLIYLQSLNDKKNTKITDKVTTNEQDNEYISLDLPEYGKLIGSIDKTSKTMQEIYQFLGIPFAKNPINELRFQPPVPISNWHGSKDATKYGRRCPTQHDVNQKYDELAEDCLNLCVYTKDLNKKRPVMVYIHGGALSNGTAMEHKANFLLEKDIVLVVIQYRLGALGFLSTQSDEIPGNMAILDIKLSLEWIQKNIQYFGGNSNDITIFGESAGGAIVSLLMISPIIPQGLFHKVIIQSGSILMTGLYDTDPLNTAYTACKTIGCENCGRIKDLNNCFKNAKLIDLLNAGIESKRSIPFALTIDDYNGVLPKIPKQLLLECQNEYQLMAGVVKHDGAFILAPLDPNLVKTPQDYLRILINFIGEPDESGILSNLISNLYFKEEDFYKIDEVKLMQTFVDISSTVLFKSPLQKFVEIYTQKFHTQNSYLYSLDYVGEHNFVSLFIGILQQYFPFYPFQNGVHHADDLLYLFPTYKLNENDENISNKFIDLWTSFAINGKPETVNSPEILPLKNGNGPYFHIDNEITIGHYFPDEYKSTKRGTT